MHILNMLSLHGGVLLRDSLTCSFTLEICAKPQLSETDLSWKIEIIPKWLMFTKTKPVFFLSLPEMKPRNLLHASAHSTLVKLSLWSTFSRSENIQGTVKHTRGWLYISVVCFFTEYGCSSLSAMLLKTSFTLPIWKRKAPHSRICFDDPLQNPGKKDRFKSSMSLDRLGCTILFFIWLL